MHTKICSKIILWSIWLSGTGVIAVSLYFNATPGSESPSDFVFAVLFSSIPFAVLAIYTKRICENMSVDVKQKKIKHFGIIGAYVTTLLFAIWSFSAPMDDSLNPAGFFWVLSIGSMFVGALVGIGVFKIVSAISGMFENKN